MGYLVKLCIQNRRGQQILKRTDIPRLMNNCPRGDNVYPMLRCPTGQFLGRGGGGGGGGGRLSCYTGPEERVALNLIIFPY